jgi:hypothetical protein
LKKPRAGLRRTSALVAGTGATRRSAQLVSNTGARGGPKRRPRFGRWLWGGDHHLAGALGLSPTSARGTYSRHRAVDREFSRRPRGSCAASVSRWHIEVPGSSVTRSSTRRARRATHPVGATTHFVDAELARRAVGRSIARLDDSTPPIGQRLRPRRGQSGGEQAGALPGARQGAASGSPSSARARRRVNDAVWALEEDQLAGQPDELPARGRAVPALPTESACSVGRPPLLTGRPARATASTSRWRGSSVRPVATAAGHGCRYMPVDCASMRSRWRSSSATVSRIEGQ